MASAEYCHRHGVNPKTLPRRLLGCRAIAALSGIAPVTAGATGEHIMIDLSGARPGSMPAEFTAARTGEGAASVWTVMEDATVSGGRVLAQTSTDRTDYRFPLAIYEKFTGAGVDASVRFKAVAGRIDRAGGIAIRLTDPDNYYVVRANALEDNVNLYRVVKGSRRQIKGAGIKVASDVWHTLGLRAEGNTLTVSWEGSVLFTATDTTFAQAGKVALWTKADSVTRFDALSIRALP
jgi:hypothetical protein